MYVDSEGAVDKSLKGGTAMNANVGTIDRVIRVILGVALIAATLAQIIGPWGWIGIIPLGTAAIGFCPAYRLFGLSSCAARTR